MLASSFAGICLSLELYAFLLSIFVLIINPRCTSHWVCFLTALFGIISAVAYSLICEFGDSQVYTTTYIWTLFLSTVTHSYVPVLRVWNLCNVTQKKLFFFSLPVCLFFGASSAAYTVFVYATNDDFIFVMKEPYYQLVFFIILVIVSIASLVVVLKEFKHSGLPLISNNLQLFEQISIFSIFLVVFIGCVQAVLVIVSLGKGYYSIFTHILAAVCSISHVVFEFNRQYSRNKIIVQFFDVDNIQQH